jgi:PleD family two-component response regulator
MKKPTILIVDDIPGNIKIVAEMLDDEYEIAMTTSGQDALEMVAVGDVELIILDIVMPEMDGYEVCSRLKQNSATRDIPIIFITGQGEEREETRGLDMGVSDFITKPARPAILKARIRNLLDICHWRKR